MKKLDKFVKQLVGLRTTGISTALRATGNKAKESFHNYNNNFIITLSHA